MNQANIGPQIILEGEKEYKQSIAEVSSNMKLLKSDLKAVSAAFDGNANTIEALRAKNTALTKQQEEQEKKLALLRGALEKVTGQYGENSDQAKKWQNDINNAYVELQKINRELNQNEKYMKEAEASTNKTAKSIDEFGKEIKETKEETLKFGDVLKANLAGEAIIGAVKGVFNGIKSIISETEEYRKDLSKLETNSKTAGAEIDGVKEQLKRLDAVTGETDSNIEALSNLLQTGFKNNDLVNIVDALSGAVIKFPDTLKIESLSDALQETLATGKATGQFGELLERLGYNLDTVNEGLSKTTSEAQKQQYALKLLAETGLANVNNEYREANKDMIQYAEAQFQMREVMSDIARAAVPLLSKSMSVLADNMDEIADTFLPPILNGFEWLVNNADTVEAGLKGVGAAIITKKAADGITFAIKAYGELKKTTEAATVAQTAFNTASKASVIGALISVVLGLGIALHSYEKNAEKAALETNKLYQETKNLLDATEKLNKETKDAILTRKEEVDEIENEYELAKKLTNTLYDLAGKESKSNAEKSQMAALVKQLNELVPDLNLAYNEQTGILGKSEEAVMKMIAAQRELQRVQIAGQKIAETELSIIKTEKALGELKASKEILEAELEMYEEMEKAASTAANRWDRPSAASTAARSYQAEIKMRSELLKDNTSKAEEATSSLEKLRSEYDIYMEYLGKHEPVSEAAKKTQTIVEQYSQSMTDSVSDAVDKINDIYDDASEALSDRLEDNLESIEQARKKEVELAENASKKEVEAAKNAYEKKLELINEEYQERKKLIDSEYLPGISEIDDEIRQIEAESEAEKRALEAKQEAEKKADLQARVNNAKTAEERLEASQELADYEEELNRKRRENERKTNIEILKEQRQARQDEHKAKIEELENEKKAAEKSAAEKHEAELKNIQEKLRSEIESINEVRAKEKKALTDKQRENENYLKEQKEQAVKNAKEIYDEDLRLFKLNNALKDKEISIESYIGNIKASDLQGGKVKVSTDMLQGYMQYGYPGVPVSQQAAPTFNIDYDRMTDSFVTAISKLGIVIDGKQVGKVVENKVNQMIR